MTIAASFGHMNGGLSLLAYMKSGMKTRIAIVDDDERLRSQFREMVERFADCKCVGLYSTGEEALAGVPLEKPDVVLMDINMPGMGGIECVKQLKSAHDSLEIIMLTVYQDTERVFDSLAAGASGYLLKRAAGEELHAAIQQVRAGGSPMTGQIARRVVQAFRQTAPSPEAETSKLSPREQEVLELLARGDTYKEISTSLGITYATVHNYIRRMYEKLHVQSRAQAVNKFHAKSHALGGKLFETKAGK
jgi:DNA-binding NarL/FixJ family response regulator